MTPALWLLLGLQLKGWLRYFFRNLRTVKGALLALLGLGVFLPWILTLLLAPAQGVRMEPKTIRDYGPPILLLYCVVNVLFSTGERSIYFSPAEVNLLFPGPFTRRQILAYKIVTSIMMGLPTTLIMAVFFRIHAASFLSACVGLFFMLMFMTLLTMALNLIAITLGASFYSRVRAAAPGNLPGAGCQLRRLLGDRAAVERPEAAGVGGAAEPIDRLASRPVAVAALLRGVPGPANLARPDRLVGTGRAGRSGLAGRGFLAGRQLPGDGGDRQCPDLCPHPEDPRGQRLGGRGGRRQGAVPPTHAALLGRRRADPVAAADGGAARHEPAGGAAGDLWRLPGRADARRCRRKAGGKRAADPCRRRDALDDHRAHGADPLRLPRRP